MPSQEGEGTKSQLRHCHRPNMRHTALPQPSNPAFAAMTAHGSGVKARGQNTSTAHVRCFPWKRRHQRIPGSSLTACASQAHLARGNPAAEHTSQPYKAPVQAEVFILSLPAQSLTEDAATSSGFFLRSMAGPAPPPPPSPPGGLAVKRGGSATEARRYRDSAAEGGRTGAAAMLARSGEVMGARPGVVWRGRSAPGRGFPGFG